MSCTTSFYSEVGEFSPTSLFFSSCSNRCVSAIYIQLSYFINQNQKLFIFHFSKLALPILQFISVTRICCSRVYYKCGNFTTCVVGQSRDLSSLTPNEKDAVARLKYIYQMKTATNMHALVPWGFGSKSNKSLKLRTTTVTEVLKKGF